jgi:hypothetical protein
MKPMGDKHFAVLRRHMVEVLEIHFDLLQEELGTAALDERVAEVMLRVPRHRFVQAVALRRRWLRDPLVARDNPLQLLRCDRASRIASIMVLRGMAQTPAV